MWSKSLEVLNPYEASLKMLENSNSFSVTQKFAARVIEMHDEAIYNAVVEAAREAGINQLYLLDKKFVLEALREKAERENPKTNADRIRSMSDEELAWFINLSPEMEFEVCLYCANGNTVPDDRGICLSPRGVCVANDRRDAFLVWLRQPVKEE